MCARPGAVSVVRWQQPQLDLTLTTLDVLCSGTSRAAEDYLLHYVVKVWARGVERRITLVNR